MLELADEIADACAVIQRGWSEAEEVIRRFAVHDLTMHGQRVAYRPHWDIPEVHVDSERQGREGESADYTYNGGRVFTNRLPKEPSDPFLPYMRE